MSTHFDEIFAAQDDEGYGVETDGEARLNALRRQRIRVSLRLGRLDEDDLHDAKAIADCRATLAVIRHDAEEIVRTYPEVARLAKRLLDE